MNAATLIAKECASIPAIDDHAQLVDVIDDKLLAAPCPRIRGASFSSSSPTSPILSRLGSMAVGLALGGPDFQKQ